MIGVGVFGMAAHAPARPAGATDPRQLVVRLADMPTGFVRKSGRYVSNARAERDDDCGGGGSSRAIGRINGYEATFERGSGFAVLSIGTGVSTHRTVADSRRALALFGRAVAQCPPRFGFRRAVLRERIGYEARMWAGRMTNQGFTVGFAFLMWRSGTTVATVSSARVGGLADTALVVRLARRQQARIARIS